MSRVQPEYSSAIIRSAGWTAILVGLSGCAAPFWGNLLVLGVTVGIFCGTLALGRRAEASRAASQSADASAQSSSGSR